MTDQLTPRAARDLDARELGNVIADGVFRGAMKAVAVYALISVLIWVVVLIFSTAYRNG